MQVMNAATQVTVEAHDFGPRDFIAGDPALDLVNTVKGRGESPHDWLDSYSRLLEWAERARLLPERAVRTLAKEAQFEPAAALRSLGRAKALREEMFATLKALTSQQTPPPSSLALIRKFWIEGAAAHELRFDQGQLRAQLRDEIDDLDLVAAIVAYRMVEHILPLPLDRLRMCHGQNCAWVFIDSSKAGRRRWCDMAVCGNAAKSARFYARSRRRAQVRA